MSFWQLQSQQQEGHDGNDELYDSDADGGADGTTDCGAGDDTTASGAGGDATTDGGERTDGGSQPSKPKRDRKINRLATTRDTITEVSSRGYPLAPEDVAKGYGNQLACIVRECLSINTGNLRAKENRHLHQVLFYKLHARCEFPAKYANLTLSKNDVNKAALMNMSTALSSWRSRVKKRILKGESFDEVHEHEPYIDEEEFDKFKKKCNEDESAKWTEWGKRMRDGNLGKHHLGSGGYKGKQPTWDKEDEVIRKLGLPNPFDRFTDEQVRNFVRARYYLDPKMNEFVTNDPDVQAFEKAYVSNLPRIKVGCFLYS